VQLLVSVRSAVEAEAALEGGADIIDVKEPSRGSLGRAGDDVIADVVRIIAGRRTVTGAMGELIEGGSCSVAGLTWLKWGLSGIVPTGFDWRDALHDLQIRSEAGVVVVAYADAERAGAPPVAEVCDFACEGRFPALLIDTWQKDGRTLLDWLPLEKLQDVCARCRSRGVRVALAGSLGAGQIVALSGLRPDIVAVRGAACAGGTRSGRVDVHRVRALRRLLV
jgi:uncharacterized protein (UPF0264 family)